MDPHLVRPAGVHHVTAITAGASENHRFYTRVLGMRLVKKTVNQDDVSAYHLFYADGAGTPGSDLTFFAWPARPETRGTRSVVRTGLRVAGAGALTWWAGRFRDLGVRHSDPSERNGRPVLDFEDSEGQRLSLVAEEGDSGKGGVPWERSPVPPEFQIRGLGPVTLSVPSLRETEEILTEVLAMSRETEYRSGDGRTAVHVYRMAGEGPAAELHVAVEPDAPPARQGAGGVHHVAFRVPTVEEYEAWEKRLRAFRLPNSGPVDRYYFRSLYFREAHGILFELATDGPGFAVDEPPESLGEGLALPPFLEKRRAEIERGLEPLEGGG